MLTFVCCPKPFSKAFSAIQRNAINSWCNLECVDKIVIVGNELGVENYIENLKKREERKKRNKIIYLKDIPTNKYGTPLVNHIFKIAATYCDKYVCYINCDIILTNDFQRSFTQFIEQYSSQKDFLLIGRRWDWHHPKKIEFLQKGWRGRVRQEAKRDGKYHAITGIDYFVFSKTTYNQVNIPPFGLGKFWWDLWLIGTASNMENVMTVDLSTTVFAIHQDSPWFQNQKQINSRESALNTAESLENKTMAGSICRGMNINKATQFKSKLESKNETDILFIEKHPVPAPAPPPTPTPIQLNAMRHM